MLSLGIIATMTKTITFKITASQIGGITGVLLYSTVKKINNYNDLIEELKED